MSEQINVKEKIKNMGNYKYIAFYNDGVTEKLTKNFVEDEWKYAENENYGINEVYQKALLPYSFSNTNYDYTNLSLKVGVIYNCDDVNEDNTLKEGAKPIPGLIHFYTMEPQVYMDGTKLTKYDSYYFMGKHGIVNYDEFVKNQIKNGFTYNGPKSFDELVNTISSKQEIDIGISIDYRAEDEIKLS